MVFVSHRKQMRHAYAHAHIAKPWRQTKKTPPISSEEYGEEGEG